MKIWTNHAVQFLQENYTKHGGRYCSDHLQRTMRSVQDKAHRLGLENRPAAGPEVTNAIRAVIRRAYESGERGAVRDCARGLGVDRRWVSRQAEKMGLTTRTSSKFHSKWTEEEINYVKKNMHICRKKLVRQMKERGWTRTPGGINSLVQRLALENTRTDVMTQQMLALCMGVDDHRIKRWIKRGMLRVDFRDRPPGAGPKFLGYVIKEMEVARFAKVYPADVPFKKLDGVWFTDLMCRLGHLVGGDARDLKYQIIALHESGGGLTEEDIAERIGIPLKQVHTTLSTYRLDHQRRLPAPQQQEAA